MALVTWTNWHSLPGELIFPVWHNPKFQPLKFGVSGQGTLPYTKDFPGPETSSFLTNFSPPPVDEILGGDRSMISSMGNYLAGAPFWLIRYSFYRHAFLVFCCFFSFRAKSLLY